MVLEAVEREEKIGGRMDKKIKIGSLIWFLQLCLGFLLFVIGKSNYYPARDHYNTMEVLRLSPSPMLSSYSFDEYSLRALSISVKISYTVMWLGIIIVASCLVYLITYLLFKGLKHSKR